MKIELLDEFCEKVENSLISTGTDSIAKSILITKDRGNFRAILDRGRIVEAPRLKDLIEKLCSIM